MVEMEEAPQFAAQARRSMGILHLKNYDDDENQLAAMTEVCIVSENVFLKREHAWISAPCSFYSKRPLQI